jgi:hypothetical protein
LPNKLNARTTVKMIAATIQPRLLRGGAGGVMTGGADSGGGAPAGELKLFSIVRAN